MVRDASETPWKQTVPAYQTICQNYLCEMVAPARVFLLDCDMQLGDRIRELREAQGHTQKSLASRAGLTVGHVYKIESGDVDNVKLSTIRALADALGTTIDPLVYGDGRKAKARMRELEDRMRMLAGQPDSEDNRREIRECAEQIAALKDAAASYPPAPLSQAPARKRRGPKPRR